MKNKSFIKIEVPKNKSINTSSFLDEISMVHPGFEIRLIESRDESYHCNEVFVHISDSVIDLSSNKDEHGLAVFAEVSSIISRYSERL